MFTPLRLRLLWFPLALLLSVFASPKLAFAQDVEVAWIPPTQGAVSGYNVYVAPLVAGPLIASPIDVGRPSVDGAGISRARVSVAQAPNLMIEMTSYDSSGRESARSNRVTLARGSEALEAPIWSTNFSSAALGSRAGFVGTAFAVTEHPAGNRVLGVSETSGFPVARFTGGGTSSAWQPYELSGRMFMRPGSRRAGVAVRVGLLARSGDPFGGGFRLGGDASSVFSVQANDGATLSCARSPSTGVSAVALRWYRFKLRYTEPDDRPRVRAKVWADGTAEPSGWQADCSTNALPATDSGVFALYKDGVGAVYWDDLAVAPVGGWWSAAPYL